MAFDAHKNFAYGTVATAPSPAISGTTLSLTSGQGALMPATPFNATVWPSGTSPIASNAEIVRVTALSGDSITTMVRAQEGTSAKSIASGWQFSAGITAKTATDIETATGGAVSLPPSGGDDTAAFNALLASLPTDPYGLGLPVGEILLQPGTYNFGASVDTNNFGTFVSLIGPGKSACKVAYHGTGKCFQCHNPHRPSTVPAWDDIQGWGGVIDGFTIDGTAAGAGAVGIEYGDNEGGTIGQHDLLIRNFSGVGSIGLHFISNVWWAEKTRVDVILIDNTTGLQLDALNSTDGTVAYSEFLLETFVKTGQTGVRIGGVRTTTLYNSRIRIRGNYQAGSASTAILNCTGGVIEWCGLDIQVECAAGSPSHTSIATPANVRNCWGNIRLNSWSTAATGPMAGFNGWVAGDSGLVNEATGAGSAALGSNSPATTLTAPYTWIRMMAADGSVVYVPAWK